MVDVSIMHDHRPRVPDAVRHSSCRSAEPGPYQTPEFATAPALQRTAPQVLRAALRPGHEISTAIERGGHPLRNIVFGEKAERHALNCGRLAFALRNGDQKIATPRHGKSGCHML
jgi:hypothetical protein